MIGARNRLEAEGRQSRSAAPVAPDPLRRHRSFASAVLAVTILGAGVIGEAAAEVYKYQDDDGRWHFSDRPHPGSLEIYPLGGAGPGAGRATADPSGAVGKHDLVSRLQGSGEPASPIQRCRLAVVKVDPEVGNGSGFFISDDGLILTNRHVVRPSEDTFRRAEDKLAETKTQLDRMKREIDGQGKPCREYTNADDCERTHRNHRKATNSYRRAKRDLDLLKRRMGTARSFTVHLRDRTKLKASLVAVSSQHDMALLQLRGYRTPYIPPLTERPLQDAEELYVIGSPLGIADQISSGNYTGTHEGLLGTNAKVLPGNSGGPMVTEDCRVVGVVTIKVSAGGDPRKDAGLGFAIPIDAAYADFPQLRP